MRTFASVSYSFIQSRIAIKINKEIVQNAAAEHKEVPDRMIESAFTAKEENACRIGNPATDQKKHAA